MTNSDANVQSLHINKRKHKNDDMHRDTTAGFLEDAFTFKEPQHTTKDSSVFISKRCSPAGEWVVRLLHRLTLTLSYR